ncbi:hypothetical protein COBT_004233, partial [Conglomerata obtusa]
MSNIHKEYNLRDFQRIHANTCNICQLLPREPILTFCGHIFCWPCFYTKLYDSNTSECPKCKKRILIYEIVGLHISDEIERTECKLIKNINVPPRNMYTQICTNKKLFDDQKLKEIKKNNIKRDIIFSFRITR